MATESPVRLMPGGGGSLNTSLRTSGAPSSSLDVHELSMLLKERSRYESLMNGGGGGGGGGVVGGVGGGGGGTSSNAAGGAGGDVFMHRSESAPPSVEGSLAAVNGLLDANVFGASSGRFGGKGVPPENGEGYESEEQMRSDPAYLAYYYSHINLNPRLPPPIISWENIRLAQKLAAGNKESNWKLRSFDDNNSRSLFSSQPLLPEDNAVAEQKHQDNGPVGPMSHGFGGGGRSLVDLIQQDFPRTPSPVYSYNHDGTEDNSVLSGVDTSLMSSLGTSAAGASAHMEPGQLLSDSVGRRSPYPTVRSASVEPTASASQLGSIGMGEALKRSGSSNAIDLAAALQGLNIQQETTGYEAMHQPQRDDRDHLRYRQRRAQRSPTYAEILEDQIQYGHAAESTQSQASLQPGASSSNVFAAAAAAAMSYIASGNPYYQNMYSPGQYNLGSGGYPSTVSPLAAGGYSNPSLLEAARARSAASGIDRQQLYKIAGQQIDGATLQDALYVQYLQRLADEAALRNYMAGSDTSELGYAGDPKLHYPRASLKTNSLYYGRSPYYSTLNSTASSSLLQRDTLASLRSGSTYGWHRGGDDDIRGSVLLEEFKSSKSRRFELSDISGHVVEFSADQHGSRFIQQKLEAATTEEKAMVFDEVLPQAFTLMTDVFGNYVIQKFFEHGNSEQRRQLANLLVGHMLDLSLQMYGCRVIQKALEVCDVDQQTQLVAELDGYVMRCVRDQNGNHVIQKCIECVPPDKIQFIISAFYGQVLVLSTHPYGCRVIQRVLEYCTDDQKQAGIMAEILGATCSLAQDQYGNYVIQHVLEHGNPHERSDIITKLAGQFVQMSQHKFASNVVEKCLEFGGPTERQMLVDEMLGSTEDNLPLQAMMKDQYANYVVQKVLEICSDQQREMLLGRIKTHLHALKKYTYGKHIVARVEKLVAAGERRGAAAAAAAHSNS